MWSIQPHRYRTTRLLDWFRLRKSGRCPTGDVSGFTVQTWSLGGTGGVHPVVLVERRGQLQEQSQRAGGDAEEVSWFPEDGEGVVRYATLQR